ncbi:MAG: hypothetical protein ACREC6_14315 [Hyphomicrobiaceae bacterium]
MSDQRRAIEEYLAKRPEQTALAAIVRSVEDRLQEYEHADALALKHQALYKRLGWWALVTTTIGTLAGAVALFPLDVTLSGRPRTVIGAAQGVAVILAMLMTWLIGRFDSVGVWMRSRGEAERLRGEIFEAILKADTPHTVDKRQLWRQKLDLTMAAHVDYQLAFFKKSIARAKRGLRTIDRARLLHYAVHFFAVLIGIASLLPLLYLLGLPTPEWFLPAMRFLLVDDASRWQLGLGTIAVSLLTYTNAYGLLNQDKRNIALYTATAGQLEQLKTRELIQVQQAAFGGDGQRVRNFHHSVSAILEADYLAWSLARTYSV